MPFSRVSIHGKPAGSADSGAWEYGGGSGGLGTRLPPRIATSTGSAFYVNPSTGNNGNPGTIGSPWATIAHAMATVGNNSIVYLRGGNYPERVDPLASWSGTATGVKTLKAYPGEVPILQRFIRIDPAEPLSYWRFENLTFWGTLTQVGEDTSFYGRSGSHIEFFGCTIRSQPLGSGMVVNETACSDYQWWNCRIFQNGRNSTILDHGLYLSGTGHVVANCLIYKNSSYGVQLYPEANRCFIVNNTIVENGIRTSDAVWTGGIVVESNVSGASNNNIIANNILGWNDGYGARTGNNPGPNNQLYNNIGFGNVLGDLFQPTVAFVLSGNVVSDPLLVNRAGEDYRLSAGSPARGLALPDYAPAIDIAGALR